MSYTETEIDLIHKWRPYYSKMIRDAIDRVVLEELKYVKSYIIRDYEKDRDSLLMKAAAELDKKIYKYDDEKQKEVDASMLEQHLRNPTVAYSFMGQAKKDHPDQAQEIEALSLLYIALDIMKSTSEICSDGWLLSVLTYFYGLYQLKVSQSAVLYSDGRSGILPWTPSRTFRLLLLRFLLRPTAFLRFRSRSRY